MTLPRLIALVAVALLAGLAAAPAGAAVQIIETSENATRLGVLQRGSCSVVDRRGERYFRLTAATQNRRWRLSLTILEWRGYNRQYMFRLGTNDPGVWYLSGPGGPYSNIFAPPGTRGLQAGGIAVRRGRVSMGFLPTGNRGGDKGVVLAGQMPC